jgi:hypothetical protein
MIKEIINEFDTLNRDKFCEFIIDSHLRKYPISENSNYEDIAETLAFGFSEDYHDEAIGWGTYFGPMMVSKYEDGKQFEYPSINQITPEIIKYWETRAKESIHPILTARYSGLVFDFSKKILGKKSTFETVTIYIKALIDIATGDLCNVPTQTFSKLERALNLSISINNVHLTRDVKSAIINYETLITEDSKPGLWGYSFDLCLMNKKVQLTDAEEQDIINELNNKFERFTISSGIDLWGAENAAKRLMIYYHQNKQSPQLKKIIDAFATATKIQVKSSEAMQAVHLLEKIYYGRR